MISGRDAGLAELPPSSHGGFPEAVGDGNPESRVWVSARRAFPAAPGSCARCPGNGSRRLKRLNCRYGSGGDGEKSGCRATRRRGGRALRLRRRRRRTPAGCGGALVSKWGGSERDGVGGPRVPAW